ncbi:MAG: cyclic nucleotide-binding domain-containing protein [Methylobacillus glycogenes]|nr:cyclic nucleotide-binding domain-containing protein [Methylobacillus glycogenes]
MHILETFLLQLEPILSLSKARLHELATLSFIEYVNQDIDPWRLNVNKNSQVLYLLQGELTINYVDGSSKVLVGGSEAAKFPVGSGSVPVKDTRAITDIQIVRIDTDLLDIMMTWDQLAGDELQLESSAPQTPEVPDQAKWMRQTDVFGVSKLQNGLFSRLPAANIEEMFRRMELMPVTIGQVIIRQGEEGDYYYLIDQGQALVSRRPAPGQPDVILAELGPGTAFGEEALVSSNRRNATIVMKTSGLLLRLKKQDFLELLQTPLLQQVTAAEAEQLVKEGAVWLDVRLPAEYDHQHLPGAINVPLYELRNLVGTLDKQQSYITYCHTGRRSSAAAIILLSHGFDVRGLASR